MRLSIVPICLTGEDAQMASMSERTEMVQTTMVLQFIIF